jgi:3-dehydroquinate synthase
MPTVELNLPHHRYTIHVEPGLLRRLGDLVREVASHDRAAVFADGQVVETHGQAAVESLRASGYDVLAIRVPPGEQNKDLEHVRLMYDQLIDARMERKSPVIAIGGGVIGDTVGFVAATYLRGVPFIQCPTTLLAMVDASVGGKVGVNLPQGKNLIGAFHQPSLVAIDTDVLASLPARELRCGLAECVKHAVIRDADLFAWLEQHLSAVQALDSEALVELVGRNVWIKADVVMADEKEAGERAHLNFGHTFGHAIEATTGYGVFHHGEAVALGMVAATRLAVCAGRCEPGLLDHLIALLDRIGLPTTTNQLASTDELMIAMRLDKKVADGRIRLILPDRLGAVSIVNDVNDAAIAAAIDSLRRQPR